MGDTGERPANFREFGRDGISGMVTRDRAIRARQVSQPTEQDLLDATKVVDSLIARATGRQHKPRS